MSDHGGRSGRERGSSRKTGYYVVKNDWPTKVPGVDMSLEQLYTALDRLDDGYSGDDKPRSK